MCVIKNETYRFVLLSQGLDLGLDLGLALSGLGFGVGLTMFWSH